MLPQLGLIINKYIPKLRIIQQAEKEKHIEHALCML